MEEKKLCLKKVMIWSYCFGIAAHGIMMFNKLSWHDDLKHYTRLYISGAMALGRWLRAILAFAVRLISNGNNWSLPLFHGLISIFFIALSAFILIQMFHIEDNLSQIIVCGLMVTFPVVTSTFAYMFTAPYYFIALFLAVFAVYLTAVRNNVLCFILSALCICCSLGLYQAYFAVSVTCFALLMITNILDSKFDSVKEILLQGLRYLIICLCGLISYFLIWIILRKLTHVSVSNYQGISEIGHSGIQKYLYAIRQAYEYFFLLPKEDACDLFPLIGTKIIQWSIIIVFIGISIAIIIREVQKNVVRGLILACLIAILPLCYYLAFLLSAASPDSFVHAVMLYACSLQFVYYLWLLQYLKRNDFQLINLVKRVSIVLMALLLIMNVKFANVCYLKADIVLSQTKSELTALVTRIKSLEQYADELPVTIIMSDYNDSTIADNESFSDIIIVPYASDTFSSYTYSKQYLIICLEDYCGFAPEYVDSKEFENKAEVLSMPSYPDAGSIQIIDGTIVLKL